MLTNHVLLCWGNRCNQGLWAPPHHHFQSTDIRPKYEDTTADFIRRQISSSIIIQAGSTLQPRAVPVIAYPTACSYFLNFSRNSTQRINRACRFGLVTSCSISAFAYTDSTAIFGGLTCGSSWRKMRTFLLKSMLWDLWLNLIVSLLKGAGELGVCRNENCFSVLLKEFNSCLHMEHAMRLRPVIPILSWWVVLQKQSVGWIVQHGILHSCVNLWPMVFQCWKPKGHPNVGPRIDIGMSVFKPQGSIVNHSGVRPAFQKTTSCMQPWCLMPCFWLRTCHLYFWNLPVSDSCVHCYPLLFGLGCQVFFLPHSFFNRWSLWLLDCFTFYWAVSRHWPKRVIERMERGLVSLFSVNVSLSSSFCAFLSDSSSKFLAYILWSGIFWFCLDCFAFLGSSVTFSSSCDFLFLVDTITFSCFYQKKINPIVLSIFFLYHPFLAHL